MRKQKKKRRAELIEDFIETFYKSRALPQESDKAHAQVT